MMPATIGRLFALIPLTSEQLIFLAVWLGLGLLAAVLILFLWKCCVAKIHAFHVRRARRILPAWDFDESVYLAANPDVADAVAKGQQKSGRRHYILHGH